VVTLLALALLALTVVAGPVLAHLPKGTVLPRPLARIVNGIAASWRGAARVLGWSTRRGFLRLAAPWAAVVFWLVVAPWLLIAVWVLVVTVNARAPRVDNTRDWWSEGSLTDALITTGLVRAPKDGERIMLRRLGPPRHTEHGTTVVLSLPPGVTCTALAGKREALAASLSVPTARLTVDQDPDAPANVVRVRVAAPRDTRTHTAPVARATRTRFGDPVRVGRRADGTPVTLRLPAHNTLIAGKPGMGKTSLARIVLAHALLDPDARCYVLDGKGSRDDYGHAEALTERTVWGTDEDAPEHLAGMLDEVLAIVRDRNATSGRRDWPGVLVVLEELQDVRDGADKHGRESIDRALRRIVRMGRAVNVHVVVSTQRPTVTDLPSGVRNLITQGVCLNVRNPAEVEIALGVRPDLPVPTEPGRALIATPGGVEPVTLDHLTDAGWRAVTERARSLRPERRVSAPPVSGTGPVSTEPLTAQPVSTGPVSVSGDLLDQAAAHLAACPDGAATPRDLWAAIGHSHGNATLMGRDLAAHGLTAHRGTGGARRYRHSDALAAQTARGNTAAGHSQ
jgi:hypothetical protein